jgi:hypothetical protein
MFRPVVSVRNWRADRAESAHGAYLDQSSNDANVYREGFGLARKYGLDAEVLMMPVS